MKRFPGGKPVSMDSRRGCKTRMSDSPACQHWGQPWLGQRCGLGVSGQGSLEVCRLNSSGNPGQCGNSPQPIDICTPGVQTDCRATVNRNKRLPSCCWGCGGAEKIWARSRDLAWCTWQMSAWLALPPFPAGWPGPRHRCTKRVLQQLKILLPHMSGCRPALYP